MARTSVGQILLQEVSDTIGGNDGTSIVEVYKDIVDKPTQKPASSIGGLSAGWLSTIPSTVNFNLWGSFGTPTPTGSYDGGNLGASISQTLDGGNSGYGSQSDSAEGNHYSWTDIHLVSGMRLDGNVGNNGNDGLRGAGRFFKNIVLFQYIDTPAIGSSEFNQDAMQAICEARGGEWNVTCSLSDGYPRVGDVVTISYYDYTGTLTDTRVGIHDGTGTADNDWSSLGLEIDGDLLVDGTVVADTIVSSYIITNDLKGGAKPNANGNDGNAGYYFDNNGNMAIGDGTNDLVFASGVLKVPSKALTTTTTPSDTLIHYNQTNANKFTLKVSGGKGFVSVGESISLSGRVVNSGNTSTATIPTSELEDDAVYAITAGNPSTIGNTDNDMIKDLNFVVYINPSFAPDIFTSISIGDGNVGGNDGPGNATVKLFSGFLFGDYNSSNNTYAFKLEMVGASSQNTGGALRAHPINSIKRIA